MTAGQGPLAGVRVVELVGQGPGPMGATVLADLGCDVVAVDRPSVAAKAKRDRPSISPFTRGKRTVSLDLKNADDMATLRQLIDRADVLVDPFRPGVCERLGIGPEVVCASNPRLIFARMTGFGQDGPMAMVAGHDINYISLSGALDMLGEENGPPQPPINLLGDFAGGGMLLALGVSAALVHQRATGQGQVIDVSMVEGAAMVAGTFYPGVDMGNWGPRGTNHLDGAAPFYGVFQCKDGGYFAIGAIEDKFFAELIQRMVFDDFGPQWDKSQWPAQKKMMADMFMTKTRDEWSALLEGFETCATPVLSVKEVETHPHTKSRGTVVRRNGGLHAQAAPRFSGTPVEAGQPVHPGSHDTAQVLADWS